MPRRSDLSERLRSRIVDLHEAGNGYKRISKSLDVPVSTIRRIIYKWRTFGTVATLPRCGRPVKRTARAPHRMSSEHQISTVVENPDLMDQSTELKSTTDQSEDDCVQLVDEELDGVPVIGAEEDDWEEESIQKKNTSSETENKTEGGKESQDSLLERSADTENSYGSSVSSDQRKEAPEENRITPISDSILDVQDVQSDVQDVQSDVQDVQSNVQSQSLLSEADKTVTQSTETPSLSPAISIKDEPMDEEYDKALFPQSDHSSSVKQELDSPDNNDEGLSASDELRISSVFSVQGVSAVTSSQASSFTVMPHPTNSLRGATLVLPSQHQAPLQLRLQTTGQIPQLQIQPQILPQLQLQSSLQPPAPPPPQMPALRVCCSGCSKVLQKGQTAFQRKGSNQLFCSTMCLTSFSLPSVQFTPNIAPKKTCNLCLKVIVNLKDLVTIPVGPGNMLKEFCGLNCLKSYKESYEDGPPELFAQCSVCKLVKEVQHEVTHLGSIHKLCSDDCFALFRSSRNLYMSYCENCGNCTASGNYHLVQIEDGIKKFCSTDCISSYKQKSGKRLSCPNCENVKDISEMMEGTNMQGVTEFFCSQKCTTQSQASPNLTGTSFPCTTCKKIGVPQYHLAISDGSIRNFCSLECVAKFQETLNAPVLHNQMNGTITASPIQSASPSQPISNHHPPPQPCASGPSHNPTQPSLSVPAGQSPSVVNLPDLQQKPSKLSDTLRLPCKQCLSQFASKPEVFQFKSHVGFFCSRECCETFKKASLVQAPCEYCKTEKIVKDIIVYEKVPRCFCCEGCKLLFKHDLAKRHGTQCRLCVYCQNMTHKTIPNFFGGKLEEFCSEECMSLYTVLFYEMAKCHSCKNQGSLKESLVWDGATRHFCNLTCLLQFCSKCISSHQLNNGVVHNTSTLQAPLSLSKDPAVIGGIVSLASTLPGNTALTGALPTSNASSKNIGEASTQTDAAESGTSNRRTLKNKALMCRPITEEQGVQCQPASPAPQTVMGEDGEKVRLVPVPIPVPVYIPVPMHLYTQYTPLPLSFPLPLPVPVLIPGSQAAPDQENSLSVPSSVEEEETLRNEKPHESPAEQSSAHHGDLEAEAASRPFSGADEEETGSGVTLNDLSVTDETTESSHTYTPTEKCDLEHDFPRSTDPGAAKDNRLILTLKRRKRGSHSPRKRWKEDQAQDGWETTAVEDDDDDAGRRRSGADTSCSVWLSTSNSKLNQKYGVEAWSSWVQTTCGHNEPEQRLASIKENVLECSSEELSYGLCRFIKEVRRPNGQSYEPDSIYYLCLGIQQCLLDNGRFENIFMDALYNRFITDITTLLKDWGRTLPPGGFMLSRVEEEYLWECKQLGALSPIVLLNTLLFFGVKLLNLKSVEQQQSLTFSNVSNCTRTTKTGVSSYLQFTPSSREEATDGSPASKKRKEETVMEMPENTANPLRCPVRLYEFYLSKCPASVKQHPDLFYLQPEASCHPSSPVWYRAQPLDSSMMESMLTRILAVQDIHLDWKQQKNQDSSGDESS